MKCPRTIPFAVRFFFALVVSLIFAIFFYSFFFRDPVRDHSHFDGKRLAQCSRLYFRVKYGKQTSYEQSDFRFSLQNLEPRFRRDFVEISAKTSAYPPKTYYFTYFILYVRETDFQECPELESACRIISDPKNEVEKQYSTGKNI